VCECVALYGSVCVALLTFVLHEVDVLQQAQHGLHEVIHRLVVARDADAEVVLLASVLHRDL
jgi:hypothetical protein